MERLMKRLLDHDPLTGLQTFHDYDEATDTTIIRYEQDCQFILDANKRDQNHADRKMGDMVHAARIPAVVVQDWMIRFGVDAHNPDHKQAVAKLLDSSEWRHLKRLPITLGRV